MERYREMGAGCLRARCDGELLTAGCDGELGVMVSF